jgi:RNA recognition motif-containing protein
MGTKLYVGNLGYSVSDSALEQLFAPHGTVRSAQVILDRDTGRSKGFGFVEMSSEQEAQAAIAALNGKEVEGRTITVSEARAKEGGDRGSRGGFGSGGGGGGRGGRGGGGGGGGRRY